MYERLPLEALVPNRQAPNRMSRMFAKKLRRNIKQVGLYETLTVRPHPLMKGKFELLNGHARLEALRGLGADSAKCEVWQVAEREAQLFLAILNKLKGSDVPELRMKLLLDLLQRYPKEELASRVPETVAYPAKLEGLPAAAETEEQKAPKLKPDVIIVNFYLTSEQHRVVSTALDDILQKFGLSDSAEALVKMAQLYVRDSSLNSNTARK